MEQDPATLPVALISAGLTLAGIAVGVLPFLLRIAFKVGKTLRRMEEQAATLKAHGKDLKGHGDTLAEHGRILTNGLRAEVKQNSDRIGRVEGRLGQITERLDEMRCKHPAKRPHCQPAAPHNHRKGNHR